MTAPARRLARAGASAASLLALMVLASAGLWIGVPLAWLWIGSRVDGATHSLGAAVAVMFAGTILSIAVFVPLLGWLNHKHLELRTAQRLDAERDDPFAHRRASRAMLPARSIALEVVLVLTAAVAAVIFCVWFVLAGANPFPLTNPA